MSTTVPKKIDRAAFVSYATRQSEDYAARNESAASHRRYAEATEHAVRSQTWAQVALLAGTFCTKDTP